MSGQHDRFLQRLKASRRAVHAVAYWLGGKGYSITIDATRYTPTAAEAADYVDDGDIIVDYFLRYEVKHRPTIHFTSRDDWPHPNVLVSNVAAVDRAGDTVEAYVTVSDDYRHAAIIPGSTRKHWFVKETDASNTGNRERNYACPLDHVIWVALLSD